MTPRAMHGLVVAVLLLLGVTAGAAAAAQGPVATVELSGVVILRVRDAGPWESVYARADQVYRRLNEAINTMGDDLSPDLVQVVLADGLPTLTVAHQLIVTVLPVDATLNGTTPARLARIWAANLKAAIARFVDVHRASVPPTF